MKIKNCPFLIDESNLNLAFFVDPSKYNIKYLNNQHLTYKVNYANSTVTIYTEDLSYEPIEFIELDRKAVYFAYKTETLLIFSGKKSNKRLNLINVYEAILDT
ncbi:hypothetical protein GW796_07345 [archaeon]|nr:hypothetical protein [archaeon]NCQ51698.1 hypothetical protein [archaeon]